MTQKLRILAAILNTTELVMYKEDGSTETVQQGDPRLPKIIEAAARQIPALGYADIDLEEPIPEVPHFEDVEKKSNGLVRFFRVAKEKIKHLFTPPEPIAPIAPMEIGQIPVAPLVQAQEAIKEAQQQVAQAIDTVAEAKAQQHLAAAAEIIAHATPASDPKFMENVNEQQKIKEGNATPAKDTTAKDTSHTIVAVVGDKVIPSMEKISNQFERASKRGSIVGVTKFLERLAAVVHKRSHSVEDVLKFLERCDLPIADDGTIVAYKVLAKAPPRLEHLGKYMDCHSKNVAQSVGSFVHMDESMVDPDRRNDCSNGLHVARRGYVGGFGGDFCTVIKMAPEDVIAVPQYDANKIRVCGYHIIHELPSHLYDELKQNNAITGKEEGQALLARILRGEHIGIPGYVKIGGHKGTNVTHTKVNQAKAKSVEKIVEKAPEAPQDAIKEAVAPTQVKKETALDDRPAAAAIIDPKAVDKAVAKEAVKSKKDVARDLYDNMVKAKSDKQTVQAQAYAQELLDFKKKAKKGWDVLGIVEAEIELIKKTAE